MNNQLNPFQIVYGVDIIHSYLAAKAARIFNLRLKLTLKK